MNLPIAFQAPDDSTPLQVPVSAENPLPVYLPGGLPGGGDVSGPAISVANDLASFSDTTGRVIKDSGLASANVVTAAAAFAADNRLLRSDGAVKGSQASPLICDDSGNVTGVANITASGEVQTTASGAIAAFTGENTHGTNYIRDVTSNRIAVLLKGANGSGCAIVPGTGFIGFSSDDYSVIFNSQDTCFSRNAAGVFEINNGTPGTFRDLKLRNLIASGGTGVNVATVGTLPTTAATGRDATLCWVVTDALAPAKGSPVSAGGAARTIVQWDNVSAWIVI